MKFKSLWVSLFLVFLVFILQAGILHAQVTITISGQILDTGGRGVDGISISFSDGSTPFFEITSGGGYYSHTVSSGWAGTITPNSNCYSFVPASASIGPLTVNTVQDFTASLLSYTISGSVTDGSNAIIGAVITLSTGPVTMSIYDGTYSINIPCGFTGSISIMYPGYDFSPSSFVFEEPVTENLLNRDFLGTISSTTYTISGTIADESGRNTLDGVVITFFDGSTVHEEITAGGGIYSYTVPNNWVGTVSPGFAGQSFTPAIASLGPVNSNIIQDFTASSFTPVISGTIIDTSSNPIVGVTLNLSTGGTYSTGGDGTYSITINYGWSGRVTPSKAGWKFEPIRRDYTNVISDIPMQLYIGTNNSNKITISGTVKYGNGTGIPGVTVFVSGESQTILTDDKGFYSKNVTSNWSGTITPALSGYIFDPVIRTYTGVKSDLGNQDFIYNSDTPEISLNPGNLKFAADTEGNSGGDQSFLITNSGGGTLNWSLSTDAAWLNFSPSSGINAGTVIVSVDSKGLAVGTYSSLITAVDPNASNSPQTLKVKLTIRDSAADEPPFGNFATPFDGSTVGSSIPVTGWALDDIGVDSVKIYIESGSGLVYIGDAVFVEGARPDVELYYPTYPNNNKAGWGYMLLTNFLPDGDGPYILHAIVTDIGGNEVNLGTRLITVDNANAVKPFGNIDTPEQGGEISGSAYRNNGWVLTPQPNTVPFDGSTIEVYVDGVFLGNPDYDIYREDIASLFPGYNNSNGAHAYFEFDTSAYKSGIHTIQWIATDDAGNIDGIGSRFFKIMNTGADHTNNSDSISNVQTFGFEDIKKMSFIANGSLQVKKGFNEAMVQVQKDKIDKAPVFVLKTSERLVIDIPEQYSILAGYSLVGDQLRKLPIGSSLKANTFTWHAIPGFAGLFDLIFVLKDQDGNLNKATIRVEIN